MILAEILALRVHMDETSYTACPCCADGKQEVDFALEVEGLIRPLWICRGCARELHRERAWSSRFVVDRWMIDPEMS